MSLAVLGGMKNEIANTQSFLALAGAVVAAAGLSAQGCRVETDRSEDRLEEHVEQTQRTIEGEFIALHTALSRAAGDTEWRDDVRSHLNRLQVRWSELEAEVAARQGKVVPEVADTEDQIARALTSAEATIRDADHQASAAVRNSVDETLDRVQELIADARGALAATS